MVHKFRLFTKAEEKQILQDFSDIANTPEKEALKNFPRKKFVSAISGMNFHVKDNMKTKELYQQIKEMYNKKQYPMIHNDSLSAWCNQAAEQYGLEIRDILDMKPGEEYKVIFIDRNVGEYTNGKLGKKYYPKKEGFTYATYRHEKGLRGTLKMNSQNEFECFEFEINGGCNGCFWGPIPKNKYYKDYSKTTKVGWRGPSILFSDLKHLPKYFVHYDTVWDDYPDYRHKDFSKVKRVKITQQGGNTRIFKLVY